MTMHWREKAACQDLDVEFFFPLGTTGPALDQTNQAKAICANCPVSRHCLVWALANHQNHGIWGGLTGDERHKLRRRRGQ